MKIKLLTIVLTDGLYICVPISSYLPRDKIIQLTVGQEMYTFKVQE